MSHPLELKIPPLVLVAIFSLLMWLTSKVTPPWPGEHMFGSSFPKLLLVVGITFVVLGVVTFRRYQTTVDPTNPDNSTALVMTGVYKVSRNPMYVGFLLVLMAWGTALDSPVAVLLTIGFILYLNRFQIGPEERALEAQFGDTFRKYCESVRRWL